MNPLKVKSAANLINAATVWASLNKRAELRRWAVTTRIGSNCGGIRDLYLRAAVVAGSEAGLPQSTIGVRHDATRTCAKESVAVRAHRRRGSCSDRCVLPEEDAAELAVAPDAAHTKELTPEEFV